MYTFLKLFYKNIDFLIDLILRNNIITYHFTTLWIYLEILDFFFVLSLYLEAIYKITKKYNNVIFVNNDNLSKINFNIDFYPNKKGHEKILWIRYMFHAI